MLKFSAVSTCDSRVIVEAVERPCSTYIMASWSVLVYGGNSGLALRSWLMTVNAYKPTQDEIIEQLTLELLNRGYDNVVVL